MKRILYKRLLKLEEINARAQLDPAVFIEEENRRYFDEVETLSRQLTLSPQNRCLVMLSGPSSSGKTTTALLLRDSLRELGVDAHTVSLDNFYRGRTLAPRLPDGSYDYEALEALNIDQLCTCMRNLLEQGKTRLPVFDFPSGRPLEETVELRIAKDSVVIFEGIHALNPIFEAHLPQESLFKIFINTITPIYDGNDKLLARRDVRLVRRMLRDERFRNSPVENTLDMWQQVVRGENVYLFPYVDTVDYVVDTTHAYEPCVFAQELLPQLLAVPESNPYYALVTHLMHALEPFVPIAPELVPKRAMLREFLGGGLY